MLRSGAHVGMLAISLVASLGCRPKSGAATTDPSRAPDRAAAPTRALDPCGRAAKRRVDVIPDAPFADDHASLAWTGERVLIWDREGKRAASYLPGQDDWTVLDDRFPGMRVHGVAGRSLVVAREGQFPKPLAGLVVDAHDGSTTPFEAPTKVLLEPLTVGDTLSFATDGRAALYSNAPILFTPGSGRWLPVTPVHTGEMVRDDAHVIGESFVFRWGGADSGGLRADGSVIDIRTGKRVELGSGGLSPRSYALADADGSRVVVWGGQGQVDGQFTALDDGAVVELDTGRWQPIPSLSSAGGGTGDWRGLALTSEVLLVWGRDGDGMQLARYDLRTHKWTRERMPGALDRFMHELDDRRLLFLLRESAMILDPVSLRGCELSLPEGARERTDLHSAWTGAASREGSAERDRDAGHDALVLWGGSAFGGSGGCEDHRGPEGCDPWVERIPQSGGWLLRL